MVPRKKQKESCLRSHEFEAKIWNRVNAIAGTRAIVLVHIHQVGSSCGFSVPKYDFKEFRPTLNEFFEKRVANEEAGRKEDGIERYLSPPLVAPSPTNA